MWQIIKSNIKTILLKFRRKFFGRIEKLIYLVILIFQYFRVNFFVLELCFQTVGKWSFYLRIRNKPLRIYPFFPYMQHIYCTFLLPFHVKYINFIITAFKKPSPICKKPTAAQ